MSEAVSLNDVYQELKLIRKTMVSKEELNGLLETVEILHNHDTMKQIMESEADIKTGKTKQIKGVKDLLAEL